MRRGWTKRRCGKVETDGAHVKDGGIMNESRMNER